MLKGPFIPRGWMGATSSFEASDWVMVGIPYDGTCSFRPGTRFGPEAIRSASQGIETYSPLQDKTLDDIVYYDAGDLDLPLGNRDKTLQCIEEACRETLQFDKRWLGIGGEHLVTYPAIKAYAEKYPDLCVVHMDAHADLRQKYLDEALSHATVMRRVVDTIGPDCLLQVGVRSGTKEEFQWMREQQSLISDPRNVAEALKKFAGRPIYLTVDLDILDCSYFPGTGTPEPGGYSFSELMTALLALRGHRLVGADVVELSPHYDASGTSTVVAAKVIREVLLLA